MAHEPIQFGPAAPQSDSPTPPTSTAPPQHLDLEREKALTITWPEGHTSVYPIAYLRRHSPSAETKALLEEQARNPLTVLPASAIHDGPLVAESAELVGNYALRIRFSDGHDTGIYTWQYLREIDPDAALS